MFKLGDNMRIIAGTKKGRKILSPHNKGKITKKGDIEATRPTLDRVKEAMFNIIGHRVYKSDVLDMFAGTGSLGLEALSRGAKRAVFLEKYKETYDILNTNIKDLGFDDVSNLVLGDSYISLRKLYDKNKSFDIIFVDPPYLNDMVKSSIDLIFEYNLLKKDGLLVSKYDTSEELYEGKENLKLKDKRKYGKTYLGFYEYI